MTSPYSDPTRVPPEPYRTTPDVSPLPETAAQQWPDAEPAPATADTEEAEREASYARYRAESRSLGEIASDLIDNAGTLIRQEVELAKVEAKESVSKAGRGVGFLVGAALAGLLALFALTLGLWWGLAVLIGSPQAPALGWSGLIVALIWGVAGAILAVTGKNEIARMRGLPDTADTVKKIPNAVAGNEERNR